MLLKDAEKHIEYGALINAMRESRLTFYRSMLVVFQCKAHLNLRTGNQLVKHEYFIKVLPLLRFKRYREAVTKKTGKDSCLWRRVLFRRMPFSADFRLEATHFNGSGNLVAVIVYSARNQEQQMSAASNKTVGLPRD